MRRTAHFSGHAALKFVTIPFHRHTYSVPCSFALASFVLYTRIHGKFATTDQRCWIFLEGCSKLSAPHYKLMESVSARHELVNDPRRALSETSMKESGADARIAHSNILSLSQGCKSSFNP